SDVNVIEWPCCQKITCDVSAVSTVDPEQSQLPEELGSEQAMQTSPIFEGERLDWRNSQDSWDRCEAPGDGCRM
ncbi:MAG: hypothetical protein U0792_22720, partial [Gemmataceae bacterium]